MVQFVCHSCVTDTGNKMKIKYQKRHKERSLVKERKLLRRQREVGGSVNDDVCELTPSPPTTGIHRTNWFEQSV